MSACSGEHIGRFSSSLIKDGQESDSLLYRVSMWRSVENVEVRPSPAYTSLNSAALDQGRSIGPLCWSITFSLMIEWYIPTGRVPYRVSGRFRACCDSALVLC
jgi:hypothetical protein